MPSSVLKVENISKDRDKFVGLWVIYSILEEKDTN